MTAFDQFDPFERRIASAIEEIAAARLPDYLDDVLQLTARTSQRPRWTFPERWLPMDLATRRPMVFGRLPLRPLILLLVLALLAGVSLAVWVGSHRPVLLAYGPADNGQLVFGQGGDLYVLDDLSSQPRLLVSGAGDEFGAVHSPDGELVAYDNVQDGIDHVWVAGADGSNPRQVFDRPFNGLKAVWSSDSQSLALVTQPWEDARPELWIAPADASGARRIDVDHLIVWDVDFDPQQPGVLLVQGEDEATRAVDFYYVDGHGTVLSKLDLTGGQMLDGPRYEFSGLAFSPDGKTIAYNRVVAKEPPVNRFRVYVMDRDGTNNRLIPAPLEAGYSQAWSIFSPDGTSILMDTWTTTASDEVTSQVATAPADGSAVARLIGRDGTTSDLVKAWSPDGKTILVAFGDRSQVYKVDPVSGSTELLPWDMDLPGWQRTLGR